MKHRNGIAALAAAGLVIAGAAIATPASAGDFFSFSVATPGYYVPPVVVHSRATEAYAEPYYGNRTYEDSDYGVPSYESEHYYSAGPSYYSGPAFDSSHVASHHRENLRNEEHGYPSSRWNDNGRDRDHR
jgi:hypothetical protein